MPTALKYLWRRIGNLLEVPTSVVAPIERRYMHANWRANPLESVHGKS